MKSILGNPVVQFLLGRLIGSYMLFVGVTTRWKKINRAAIEPLWAPGAGRLILCVWHGRFPLVHTMWSFKRGAPKGKMLISQSREGGIVAHTSRTVGGGVIRGSAAKGRQSKGGLEAVRAMARHLESGGMVAVTPDGPRGPRMRCKKGPVQVAKLASAPLMPVAWSTSNRIVLKSWDSFILPLPFGHGAKIWGNPIAAPGPNANEEEIERVRLVLETEMNRISAEADRIAGVPVIEPAQQTCVATAPEPAATPS